MTISNPENLKTTNNYKILFLGETYRADAQTWINGIEKFSGLKIETDEIKTIRYRPIRVFQSLFFILRQITKRYTGPKYDLVLAERSTSYGFFALFTNAKVKVVAQQGISDIYPLTWPSKIIKSFLQRVVYKRANLIHAWGEAMVPAMLRSGATPNKIMVLAKGIDLKQYRFSEKLTSDFFQLRAIVTRSLEKDYQHWMILEAVSILKSKGIHLHVTIVGGGSLKEELIQFTKSLEIEELIQFTGRIPNNELPKLLSNCPIYISVPVTEGVSSSLFEAMASGCFPIVTDLPGTKAFIHHGKNGMLVSADNPKDLCTAVEQFSKNTERFQGAVKNNRKWIEDHCDFEKNMKLFWLRYEEEVKTKKEDFTLI